MHRILLIDKGNSSVHNFRKSLINKGHSLFNEYNLRKIYAHLEKSAIDLIVIQGELLTKISNSGKFSQLASGIPKLILVDKSDFRREIILNEDIDVIPVREPLTLREFGYWTKKVIRTGEAVREKNTLHSEMLAKTRKLDLFNDITVMLNSDLDLGGSLTVIMDKLKKISGARAWSMLFIDEPLFETISLKTSKQISAFRFNKGVGITGWVLDRGVPLHVADVSKDRRYDVEADMFSRLDLKSLLCAPILIKDRVVGVLRLINNTRASGFSDEDRDMLASTSGFIAMAIERAFLDQKIKHDHLTDLFNLNYFNEVVDMEIEKALRYKLHFSVIFMDIDNFKQVNDVHGHLVGSRVLIEIAQILRDNLRKVDIIARYGGDEYVMVLPQTSPEGSYMVAERLRKIIEKNVFLKDKGYAIKLTSSFGIASCPDNAKTREELMRNADKAMYDGKYSTKNIVLTAE